MSWRYRSYNSYYKQKFFFEEKDIDFTTEYLDYHQFLLQEFFTADLETRRNICNHYIREYGNRSFAYLKRKYSEWANGDYQLTEMMRERILDLMPQLLSKQAKQKLGLHDFLATIKKTVKINLDARKNSYKSSTNLKHPQQVIEVFERELHKIKTLPPCSFRFNVLTEEEKQEALEVSKYILETKLQISFNQIEQDFNTFLPYMFRFKRGIFSASYFINSFNLNVDIANSGLNDLTIPKFAINEIEVNSQFKIYADKYLAYELVNLHSEKNKAVANAFLNSHDIKLFFDRYEELSSGESEVNMKSTFQGEGGMLSMQVKMKPLKLLKTSIAISVAKLVIYSIIIIGLVSLAIHYKLIPLLIFGGLFLWAIFYGLFSDEIKLLKNLTTEIKRYGQ